jgi:hypothetical protein
LQNTDEADPMPWFCFEGIPTCRCRFRKQLIATLMVPVALERCPSLYFRQVPRINSGRPVPHQFRIRNGRDKARRTRSISNENTAKSTNLIDILPLITVRLQVESCRAHQ